MCSSEAVVMSKADEIKWRFFRSVIDEIEEDRSNEIHVTDLVYGCMRRAYYEKTIGSFDYNDESSLMVFWIGKKLHETPLMGCMHEYPVELEVEGVKILGSIDELCENGDGTYTIVDKKTTRHSVSRPYDHHVKQIKMYASMLYYTEKKRVTKGVVLYIDVAQLSTKAFVFDISSLEYEQILNEMIDKALVLKKALDTNMPPPAKYGWLCRYCSYWTRCVKDGRNDTSA